MEMETDTTIAPEGFHMSRSPREPVDQRLLDSVTSALQAQERVFLDLKDKKSDLAEPCGTLLEQCSLVLETTRSMKSRIEGTVVDLPRPVLVEAAMQKLKTLLLMHMPRTMKDNVKDNFLSLIKESMQDTGCRLVYVGLCYCRWYTTTQPELGQQAKHSTLLVVYTNPPTFTFSPANLHSKEQTEVIDEGWFYAVEASHFAKYLVKGKSRMIESLFADQGSVILATPQWNQLLDTIDKTALLRLQPFMEQCRGQAVGAIAKKSKVTGKMKLNGSTTLYEFCESFKLLHNAVQALTTQTLDVASLDVESLDTTFRTAYDTINTMYQHEADGATKEDLFDLLLVAKSKVDTMMKGIRFTPMSDVDRAIGRWLLHLRAGDRVPRVNPGLPDGERDKLLALMQRVGGPVAKLAPENIVMVIQAGSFLYDLHTPDSDIDYLVVYAEPTENLLCSVKPIAECKENRGPNKEIEYGAYEARLFAEMLLKGSVVIAEIVYVGEAEYASEAWKELCSHSDLFVTEHVIQQYLGLISNNMYTIHNGKHKGAPRERKLFYQIFHKIWSVEAMLEGRAPPVRCSGDVKDFIMSIRQGPLEGDLSRDKLYERAENQIQSLRRRLAERPTRLHENADLSYLTDWLMGLRGWTAAQH